MDTLKDRDEREPNLPKEVERKFLPLFDVSELQESADKIEQIYLSWPNEEWNLRVRKTLRPDNEPIYEATLKSRSGSHSRALVRDEVNTEISAEAYGFYEHQNLPRLQKLRAHLGEGITMDWLTDDSGTVQPFVVEVEGTGPDQAQFLKNWEDQLIDVTHMAEYDNEHMAHRLWLDPIESPRLLDGMQVQETVRNIVALAKSSDHPIVVGVRGRSGSGKSTLARDISNYLESYDDMPVMHLSTDDYHRGRAWLLEKFGISAWKNWDAPVVYNTAALAFELREYLDKAEPIPKRYFDFLSQEPVIEVTTHQPGRVVIVEGLFPHSPDLVGLVDHMIEVPTPLATSIGRRIVRDMRGRLNDSLGNPEDILRYQVEVAEPTYQIHIQR